jgi:glycine/D-amino acid oxidase-like deaminating enzyme
LAGRGGGGPVPLPVEHPCRFWRPRGVPAPSVTATACRSREHADVVIIGGGIIGCAIAYHLALRSVDVLLLERGQLNREASGATAGNLHLQMISCKDKFDEGSFGSRDRAEADLHRVAGEVWRGLEAELRADLGVRLGGGLMVGETPADLAQLKVKSGFENTMGIRTEMISGSEIRGIEPALYDELIAADWCPAEGFANPLLVGPTYARRCTEAGARIKVRCEVTAIEAGTLGGFAIHTSAGIVDARRIVDAAGAWAARIAAMVGVTLPVEGEILQVHVTETWRPVMTTMVQHASRVLTLKQTQYGTFLIGGGWPGQLIDGEVKVPQLSSLMGNTWTAAHVMPLLKEVSILRSWAGLSPILGGRVLIVGESRVRGFYVAVPAATGFTIAPVVGRMMAEQIVLGKLDPLLEHFDVANLGAAGD